MPSVMSKSYSNRELIFPDGHSELILNLSQKENGAYDYGSLVSLLHNSPDLQVGEVCIARLDDATGDIALSIAHFKNPDPDSSMALVAHVDTKDEKLQAKAFGLGTKSDAPIFLSAFASSKITKMSEDDLKKNMDKMGISTKADGDKTRVPTAVLLYDDLFSQMLSKGGPIDPLDFLKTVLSWMESKEITVGTNDRRKNSNNIPEAAMNILVFAVYAVLRSKNGLDISVGLVDLLQPDVDFSSNQIAAFLESALLACSIEGYDDDEEEDEEDARNDMSFEERLQQADDEPSLEDTGSGMRRSSFGSISPSLLSKRRRRENTSNQVEASSRTQEALVQAADSLTTATNSFAAMTSHIQDFVATKATSSSKDFFEKEENEDVKEQFLYLQSSDGIQKADELERGTILFMKKPANKQVIALSKDHPNVKVETSMLLTLSAGVETSTGAYDTPKGLSIFGLSVQEEYNKKAMAVQMELMPEAFVAKAFSSDEIKREYMNPEVEKISEAFHLDLYLRAYETILVKFAGENSYLTKEYKKFLASFNQDFADRIHFRFRREGPALLLSILQAVNTAVAAYANSCSRRSLNKYLLDFNGILHSLHMGTFMNTYKVEIPVAPTPKVSESKNEKPTKKKKAKNDTKDATSELICSLSDLRLEDWRKKANHKRIRSLSLTVPQLRGKPMCTRFYYEGRCWDEECFKKRCHASDLNASELKSVKDFTNKLTAQG